MVLETGNGVDSVFGEFVATDWELLLLLEQLVMRSIDNIAEASRRLPVDLGFRMLRVRMVIRKSRPFVAYLDVKRMNPC
ncbi:hypothetical protein [Paenibacillus sp.]|uniref:hypothetical protein n=1 Tax=Paenibacillus sp. TaxID=58172 RepID=UPI0028AD10D9|nr:hypothetical protein [Paenibacillus sp.]